MSTGVYYLIEVPENLVRYIKEWNQERSAIADLGDDLGLNDEETAREEANRDSAVDLLHSIAKQIDNLIL